MQSRRSTADDDDDDDDDLAQYLSRDAAGSGLAAGPQARRIDLQAAENVMRQRMKRAQDIAQDPAIRQHPKRSHLFEPEGTLTEANSFVVDGSIQWEFEQPDEPMSLSIAIIGTPNVGKSALVNYLVKSKVSAVSPKRNTTRDSTLGVVTEQNRQLVIYDTPGIVAQHQSRQYQRELATAAWDAGHMADMCLVMIDAAKTLSTAEYELLDKARVLCEENPRLQLVLVLNKVDLVSPKPKLLALAEELCMRAPFRDVFYISVTDDDGVEELEDFLFASCVPREWEWQKDTVTDQSALGRVEEVIREKLFMRLHKEIPYRLTQRNIGWTELKDGALRIDQQIIAASQPQKSIVIGPGASSLAWIVQAARADIERVFRRKVYLYVSVVVKEDQHQ